MPRRGACIALPTDQTALYRLRQRVQIGGSSCSSFSSSSSSSEGPGDAHRLASRSDGETMSSFGLDGLLGTASSSIMIGARNAFLRVLGGLAALRLANLQQQQQRAAAASGSTAAELFSRRRCPLSGQWMRG